MKPDLRPGAIPEDLRASPQWVAWRYKQRAGEKKLTKVPFTTDQRNARSNDPATWTTFAAVLAAYRRGGFDGVGYVLSAEDPFAAIDLDDVVEAGVINAWALRIIGEINSYTEISPSRSGLRIMVRATLPPGARKRGQIEMYDRLRFMTLTGAHVAGTPSTVEDRQAAVEALHARELARPERPQPTAPVPARPVDLDDRELLVRILASRQGDRFARLWEGRDEAYGGDRSAGDLALCAMLSFWCARDAARVDQFFRRSYRMREKWDQRHFSSGETYGQHTIGIAVAGTLETYEGRRA